MAKIREGDNGPLRDPQQLFKHPARLADRLQGLGQDRIVEGLGWKIGKVAVRIALNHGQAPRQAGRNAAGADLQTPAVDVFFLGHHLEQHAFAAADVQHPGSGTHKPQDLAEVFAPAAHGSSPRALAAEDRKPPSAASMMGSCSRKASWPLSLSISTKLARAPAALRARTMSRLSVVG